MEAHRDYYSNFLTENYNEFFSQIETALGENTQIKECLIAIIFQKKINNDWTAYNIRRHYSVKKIPEDNFGLHRMMLEEFEALPPEAREQPDISSMIALLNEPFDSKRVQAGLNAFRESVNRENADPLSTVKRKVKEIFNDLSARNHDGIIRVLRKEIEVMYFSKDNPEAFYLSAFKKEYAQECASCKAWRTTAHKLSKCSRCLKTYYCNRECQISDWGSHKQVCIKQ